MAKKKPAKPRKRRGAGQPGVNVEEQRRARLEARRQAKAQALAARARRDRRRRLVRNALTLALLAVAVWFFFLRQTAPTEIRGHEVASFDTSGSEHVSGAVEYEETPPVGGDHNAGPSPCGVYGEVAPNDDPGNPLSNERLVHALEHGAVAVYYSPTLPPGQVKAIESIAEEFESHVITAPYEGLPDGTVVSVASWGRRMDLDRLDEAAVREYMEVFREKGPEKIDCPIDVFAPYVPELPEPEVTETPAAGDGDEDGDKGDDGGNKKGDRGKKKDGKNN